jgi:sugar diacid utilization regulator
MKGSTPMGEQAQLYAVPSTGGDDRLTLGRLLQERLLRPAVGELTEAQLERTVTWCLPWSQVVGTDDPVAGTLVYARGTQFDAQEVPRLARRGAAAIVVAGGPRPDVRTRLPVLSVGEHVGFGDLSRLVAELAFARETHVLRYGQTVHRSLVELLYRGSGIGALCHQLARLSGCAAAILDAQYRVLAFEQSRDRVLEPAAVATALRAVEPPPTPDQARGTPRVCILEMDQARSACVVNPILLAGRHDGWVLVIESSATPHPHDVAEHRVVVEQGATIVGTELLRTRSVEQAEERARGDFVHALLHARFTTQHDLEARAAHYDFPTTATFGVVVAGRLTTAHGPDSVTALFQLARDATRLLARPHLHTLATVVGDVIAVIRQVDAGRGGPEAANQSLAEYARALQHELTRRTHRHVPVAWGRPVRHADHIFDSYREARLALGLQQRLGTEDVCGFQDLRVYATLSELATSPAGRDFARDVLAPLRSGKGGVADLEQAVTTYIRFGGNLNAAARELHIHRNTMLYKLERASRALQLDLREAEHQFTVWLACKLDLLAGVTSVVDRDVKPT